MNDQEFLSWIHERLELVHKEPFFVDYMWRLRSIIMAIPVEQHTPSSSKITTAYERKYKL